MGITHLFPLSSSPINYLTINPKIPPLNPNFIPQFRPKRNRTTTSDAFRGNRFEFDDDFRGKRQRNWWSDDDDSDDEDDDDDEFEFWDQPNPFDWVFKVLSIFGWMVPAVMISNMLGTGTNSLLMAMVLPLGQTAFSLVIDRLTGNPIESSNSSSRYKSRRPKSRKRSNANNGSRGERNRTSPGRGGYQSWRSANNSSVKKGGENESKFGGWDKLVEQGGTTGEFSEEGQSREVNGIQRVDVGSGKLSQSRNGEKPLFMRLLIAVFPLLGSWTRFFF